MDAAEERRLLVQGDGDHEPLLLPSQDASVYTGDGSVDIKGRPATRRATGNWRACFFILGTECCERLAYYGIATNLVTYLKIKLHQGNLEAARNVITWQGTCYLTTLVGAILADSYWGKYWTIAVFSSIYFIGLAGLTISASLPALQPPSCLGSVCPEPSLLQNGTFFLGLYMIALGTGGIKPCVSSFGADQFDDSDPTERVKQGSFFNWFYFCINVGALLSGTVIVWIQDNSGWGIGFAIPTVFMALAIASFFSASNMYRFQKPGGSPITRVCQVVVAAFRKWHIELPLDASLLYEVDSQNSAIEGSRKLEHTKNEYLNATKGIWIGGVHAKMYGLSSWWAAIISSTDAKSDFSANPWRLCTVTQVEELKILVRMFPVWATTIIFSAVFAQSSVFVEQGMVLDKRVGSFDIPPASLFTFNGISVMIWIAIYDRVLIPIARKFTGREKGFSELQRMGIGLALSIATMVSAALVELKRLEIARTEGLIHENVAVPMSILWQIPQYCFAGAAEIFTAIGQVEFFYSQAPDAMRSLCAALALVTVTVGSYLSSIILTLVSYLTTQGGDAGWIPDNLNEGHLDRFFWLMAGISFVNLLVYIGCAMRYKYKNS
ncbi:protein NRT1/ PTR FAMILY 8.3-like isoform X3 [Triticum urartu]|uniref:protein NRT1/ PTR FAMILY 8.3-like isoform X3 n=1 Tax=Triticum urartu TaxID=4572 RepID=UPI0020449D53|nr:protein NRT1/ PTR FAMILY 8.3-like isoform X3 [Triticum urartu]XP_048571885.1 protein NRT1/ PTR FAMILY 8.3-like isoform X3 [Triticum urartu]